MIRQVLRLQMNFQSMTQKRKGNTKKAQIQLLKLQMHKIKSQASSRVELFALLILVWLSISFKIKLTIKDTRLETQDFALLQRVVNLE